MNDEATRAEVRRVLALVLGPQVAGASEIRRDSAPAWDSLKHVEILFAVEDRFGVRFAEDELRSLASDEDIARAVERHLAA
jgi:acyl carrier protein